MHHTKLFLVSACLLILNTTVASASVTLSPSLSGTAVLDPRGGGLSEPGQVQFGVGPRLHFSGYPEQLERGYLYFDLSTVAEPVTMATIQFMVTELSTGTCCLGPAVGGVGFFDVTTTPESGRAERWIDYGSGEHYGGTGLREDEHVGAVVEVDLNPTAIAGINSARGPFGIGVSGRTEQLDGASLVTTDYKLILETDPAAIPEPNSLIIFAAYSLLGLRTLVPASLRKRSPPH